MSAMGDRSKPWLFAVPTKSASFGTANREPANTGTAEDETGATDGDDALARKLQELYGDAAKEPAPERLTDIVRRAIRDRQQGD
ncbi:MAG: hypothetical protein KDA49_06920 [Rhodospirillaceae bacterium]|nr:hypothetical protein [Rhodospirillaceae bacterium]